MIPERVVFLDLKHGVEAKSYEDVCILIFMVCLCCFSLFIYTCISVFVMLSC